jgi:hypothetical protein
MARSSASRPALNVTLVHAVHDVGRRVGQIGVLDGVDLHQQDVAGRRAVDQRVQRRVARKAAIPVRLAIDFHGLEQLRQACRGHDPRRH